MKRRQVLIWMTVCAPLLFLSGCGAVQQGLERRREYLSTVEQRQLEARARHEDAKNTAIYQATEGMAGLSEVIANSF